MDVVGHILLFVGNKLIGQILKNMINMFRVESDVTQNHMVRNSCRFTKDSDAAATMLHVGETMNSWSYSTGDLS